MTIYASVDYLWTLDYNQTSHVCSKTVLNITMSSLSKTLAPLTNIYLLFLILANSRICPNVTQI